MLELLVLLTWTAPFIVGLWALHRFNLGGSSDSDGPPPPPDPGPPPPRLPSTPTPRPHPRAEHGREDRPPVRRAASPSIGAPRSPVR